MKGSVLVDVGLHEPKALIELFVEPPLPVFCLVDLDCKTYHALFILDFFFFHHLFFHCLCKRCLFLPESGVFAALSFLAKPFLDVDFDPLGLSGVSSIDSRLATPPRDSSSSDFDFF